ncbi:EAL domain-containing protein [Aureimonas sp. ME7]|uniref:sensor domain-containing phosphodiesterase n=1 Tax=Aureimonas sp. ME7 TaxID=2744252 RepID=UPI0015F70D60|nr:EAL domain-containing protein [Aureimonas sp. ME7]
MLDKVDVPSNDDTADMRGMLRLVRQNLGLDIAFVSEFSGDRRIFRCVDAPSRHSGIVEGDETDLRDSYCAHIVDGRLPEVMPDTRRVPQAQLLPVTHDLPVGSHVGVPIRLSNGMVYGTLCCVGHEPHHHLDTRDVAMLRVVAGIVAQRVDRGLQTESLASARRARIRQLLDAGGPSIVYQPVFLADGLRPAGAEALSRFPEGGVRQSVDAWFSDAADVGLQAELELAAVRNALQGFAPLWRRHRFQLGINASATTIRDERFIRCFDGYPTDRIVIELTEHEKIGDYAPLVEAFARLRRTGIKIAVDDVGAGYASMSHIVAIRPDIMKLDLGIARSIDKDPMRCALTAALVGFANQFDCRVVAEGVETPAELEALSGLDVQALQGYLLGRPMSVEALSEVFDRGRAVLGPAPVHA